MLDRCQVRTPALTQGHSEKPLMHRLGCVLRVVVLLEGKPEPQSERSGAGFHQGPLYFALLIFPSIPNSLPVNAAEKHPHSMMLPPPRFTVGMVPFGRLQVGCHVPFTPFQNKAVT